MAFVDGVFTADLQERILSSNVLVVGAGGIGCEILKNLVLSGFKRIEIVSEEELPVRKRQILSPLLSIHRSTWTPSM